jgi:outer membrane receptor protein involved in Fe transport
MIGASTLAWAQTRPGSLRGTVKDKGTGETVPFANIAIKSGATVVTGGSSDEDGRYNINPIPAGTYDVEVSFLGYQTTKIQKVVVVPDRPTLLNFDLSVESALIGEVVITYEAPLIDGTKSGKVTTQEDIANLAVRDLTSIASQTAGVFQQDEGQATFVRGARDGTTVYFIDGVKVTGTVNLPRAAIAQTEVITGGLPAQYGDATGGVINTTTRGPSPVYFGSAEYLTSVPFDQYDYNLVALTAGGPVFRKKNGEPALGFLIAGEAQFEKDPRPYAVPVYYAEESVLNNLNANPVRPATVGTGVLNNTEFVTADQLYTRQGKLNNFRQEYRINGNFNFTPSKNTVVTFGGRYNWREGKNISFFNQLFNYANNNQFINSDWSVFGRFQQTFPTENKNAAFKNFFYTLQVDYTRNDRRTQDAFHEGNVFRYGHLGRYDIQSTRFYNFGTDTVTGLTGWLHTTFQDTAVNFTAGPHNATRSNYTQGVYDFLDQGLINGSTANLDLIRQAGGLLNGDNPRSVYNGLWGNVGAVTSNYALSRGDQFRFSGSANFELKGHNVIVGFEFEQRVLRGYTLGAAGLWNQMRLLQNDAIRELDLANPQPVFNQFGVFQDTINYNRAFDPTKPRTFDRNLRKKLGLDENGTDFINVDNIDPDFFSLDMFSADELINLGGTQYVSYYGYDYAGNTLRNNPSLDDFFTARDAQGNLKREIAPFQPVYFAGYIQDQFTFDDLFFNVGVRIDRYDANQSVLRDPFVLFPTRTVGDLAGTPLQGEQIPENIGSDYVVYVNDQNNPTAIVGYRKGNEWFNADGSPQVNPNVIANASGGIKPFLFDPDNQTLTAASFVDYTPQINVMPRVSFNFPISDEALFIAHYDVLVQRPDQGLSRLDLLQYQQLQVQNNGGILNNPNLLPVRTTDYELGFQQALTDRSSFTISAFYREMRDMLQSQVLTQAYPVTYVTYGNQDFGTVKGFSLIYDLRRIGNFRMNANYTLQFADGSGSGPNSGANLAQSGQPNLRYILPFDYDSRHQIVVNLDYRYGNGQNYNGPIIGNSRILENFGVNLVLQGNSGTPFTRRNLAAPITGGVTTLVEGQINGSRLPWQARADLRVNRTFEFKYSNGRRNASFDVYVQVQNLLNTLNVLGVYPFTGSAEDDGWLASPQAQQVIQAQVDAQSYVDLYNVAVVNPFNYALPARWRLGFLFNF